MLSPDIIADEKSESTGDVLRLGIEGRPLDVIVRMRSVDIGSLRFRNVDFFVTRLGRSNGFDATLGENFLRSFDVEIDPIKNSVSFFLKNECKDRIVYWPHQDISEIPLNIDRRNKQINVTLILDGKEIPAIIDTGSSETFIDLRTAERLFGTGPQSPGMKPLGKPPDSQDPYQRAYRYQFKTLGLGDVTFNNPTIVVAPMHADGAKMILGMHELHGLHLFFAYGQGKLYLTTARGDIAASDANMRTDVPSQIAPPNPLEQIHMRTLLSDAADDLETGDIEGALRAVNGVLQRDPRSGFAYLVKAEAEFKRGDPQHALEDAARADRDHPDDPVLFLKRIDVYADAGQFALAAKDAERLAQSQAKSSGALNRSC